MAQDIFSVRGQEEESRIVEGLEVAGVAEVDSMPEAWSPPSPSLISSGSCAGVTAAEKDFPSSFSLALLL